MMQFPILASLLEGYDTCKASVKESVDVPNPTPATKKNKKMADAVFARYRNHIKTSGFNQSYAKKHRKEMNEGMHVVKSKDGIEKRFKDVNSVEAKSWKENTAKKMSVKLAVYSDSYWEKKESNSDDSNFLTPWEKIGQQGDDSDQIERLVKDQHSAGKIDWTLGKTGEMKREGTSCATRVVRIMFEYNADDDMGVDEPTSDMQSILIARNPKKPKQLDFINYA